MVLFIGHHKTGSSSLQNYLSLNALALLRAGILYPAVETEGHAHMLASALRGRDPEPGQPLPINVRVPHNALAIQMRAEASKWQPPPFHRNLPPSEQMFHAIRNQMSALNPRAVILCAEVFSHFAASAPGQIDRLRTLFDGCEISILATLRRPDDHLVSWYGQRLKFGLKHGPLRDPEHFSAYLDTIHVDYERMLRGWIEAFPDARIVLRNYGAVLAAGGSIPDFRRHAGLDFPPGMQAVPNLNPTIPVALFEVVRRANAALDRPTATRLHKYLTTLAKEIDLPPGPEIECLGAGNRDLLARRFAPVAAWLDTASGQSPFLPDLEAITRLRPIPESEAARAGLAAIRAPVAASDLPEAARAFIVGLRLDGSAPDTPMNPGRVVTRSTPLR